MDSLICKFSDCPENDNQAKRTVMWLGWLSKYTDQISLCTVIAIKTPLFNLF